MLFCEGHVTQKVRQVQFHLKVTWGWDLVLSLFLLLQFHMIYGEFWKCFANPNRSHNKKPDDQAFTQHRGFEKDLPFFHLYLRLHILFLFVYRVHAGVWDAVDLKW